MVNLSSNIFGDVSQEIPDRTGNIEKEDIRETLKNLENPVEDIILGNFDYIGEFTAKKQRSPDKPEFKTAGAFFRPNYERGLLISSLIKKYDIKTYLEIGFGRGYSCMCAAMTMEELGRGEVISIDPALEEDNLKKLAEVLPNSWFGRIKFFKSTSDQFFSEEKDIKFDMAYIDGDHRYPAVKSDWENVKSYDPKVVLFDDYHLPGKNQKDMEVSSLVDQIEGVSKKMIIMDRRIFLDDRGYTDDMIDYGQVLIVK